MLTYICRFNMSTINVNLTDNVDTAAELLDYEMQCKVSLMYQELHLLSYLWPKWIGTHDMSWTNSTLIRNSIVREYEVFWQSNLKDKYRDSINPFNKQINKINFPKKNPSTPNTSFMLSE